MKILFYILFVTVFQRSIAQNYIEIGSYGCGIMAVTGKFILLENGKCYSCRYDLRDSRSVKDSCSTDFILSQLQKDTPKKITKIKAAKISEIFILARRIVALPKFNFSSKYCITEYEIKIGNEKQKFNSLTTAGKKDKELISKFIRLLNSK